MTDEQNKKLIQQIKNKAIMLLGIREHSYKELSEKLSKHFTECPKELMSEILDDLVAKNYLSDERYTELYVRSRQKKYGIQRIKQELKQKGVSADLISEQTEILDDDQQFKNAFELWSKKYKNQLPTDSKEFAKQARFLQSRGFSFSIIGKVLKNLSDLIENSDNLDDF